MANLSIDFCRRLAQARRDRGMTQSALAREVGCKQSAVSMLEAGHSSKIAQESVAKIAEILGVALETGGAHATVMSGVLEQACPDHAFCPNARCFSNIPYHIDGRLIFWPAAQPQSAVEAKYCAVCGELLERRCPNCGARLGAGSFCAGCGEAKVTNTLDPALDADADAWAARQRREIAAWRALQV